jgi:hypothetical protein
MPVKISFQRKFSALPVYGRPSLVFGGMFCDFPVVDTGII